MEPDQDQEELVLAKTFNNSFEANIARTKLSAEGIASFLEEENVIGLNPLGGMELRVFAKDLKTTKEILSQ